MTNGNEESHLSSSYYRKDSCFRKFDFAGFRNLIGCGYILKDEVTVDAVDDDSTRYFAVWVLRGKGTYIDWNGRSYPLYPGCVFQRVSGRKHSVYIDPGSRWAECFIGLEKVQIDCGSRCSEGNFTFDLIQSLDVIDLDKPVMEIGLKPSLLKKIDDFLKQLKQANGKALFALQLKVLNILAEIDREAEQRDEGSRSFRGIVQDACEMLSENLGERLDVPDLLKKIPMSYSRLRTIFKREMGISPGTYRIQRRVEEACRLLNEEWLSPKEVAFELGYNDYYSFSNQFKKVMGISPRTFLHKKT